MRRGLLSAFIILCTWYTGLQAQDIHFSQYWMTPLQLSPAMTGAHNGQFRAGMNYRNQWFTVGQSDFGKPTFVTYSASFEYTLMRDKLDPDKFSVGMSLFQDRAGDGALTTSSIMASIAYHKAIDRYGRNHLGFGLQAGITQKRVFINDLLFENQLDVLNVIFDRSLPNQEPVMNAGDDANSVFYPDAHLGLLWSSEPSEKFRYYLTFALFHVARPRENFFPNPIEDNRLDQRYSLNLGFEIDVSRKISIAPSMRFMTQAKARQINLGTAVVAEVNPYTDLFAGVWTRMDFETSFDAFYPVVGLYLKEYGVKAGISYDVNMSDLRLGTQNHGALELQVLYIHNPRKWRIPRDHYCPNF